MEKSPYQPPSWAATSPPEGYSLEILKDGSIISSVELNKTHLIMGRMGGSVDILMEHVSISRQHCCLQFRDDGILMVLDLGSAQGSFLNKLKLEKTVYQRVNVGDILRFGSSTRMYIINGPAEQMPSEYDSANMKLYREKLAMKAAKIEAKRLAVASEGVQWGFDEDAENPQSDEDEQDEEELPDYVKNDENYDRKHGKKFSVLGLLNDGNKNNEKDKKILEKIKNQESKIQNMQEEIKRIYMKEASQPDGLTDGQNAAVDRNDKRITELKEIITELLDQIKIKNSHRNKKSDPDSKNKKAEFEKNDDNDMLDTTKETADVHTNWRLKKKLAKLGNGIRDIDFSSSSGSGGRGMEGVLTYEGLKLQKDEQLNVISGMQKRVEGLERIVALYNDNNGSSNVAGSSSASGGGDNRHDVDAIEAFVLKTQFDEAQISLKNLHAEETGALNKLKSIEKLLKIATPALQSLAARSKVSPVPVGVESNPVSAKNISTDQLMTDMGGQIPDKGGTGGLIPDIGGDVFAMPVRKKFPNNLNQDISSKEMNPPSIKYNNRDTISNALSIDKNDDAVSISDKDQSDKNTDVDATISEDVTGKEKVAIMVKKDVMVDKKDAKKRARIEESAQMQSLSSFMKFAEDEKKKNELEEELRLLKEANGHDDDNEGRGTDKDNNGGYTSSKISGLSKGPDNANDKSKKMRLSNEFTSNDCEIGTEDEKNKKILKENFRNKKILKGPQNNPHDSHVAVAKNPAPSKYSSKNVLEGGESVWIPPKNQTGDGKTSLNAKLGY